MYHGSNPPNLTYWGFWYRSNAKVYLSRFPAGDHACMESLGRFQQSNCARNAACLGHIR